MSWSPTGDRLAFFVRTEKDRSLVVEDVLTRKIVQRVELNDVDAPESPDFSPDGRKVAFSGMRGGTTDVFVLDLESRTITNVTNDSFADYAPTWTPDGRALIVLTRVSGNEKLFRVELSGGKRTQLTFGTHDEGGAQYLDDNTLVFASTAVDPNETIDPEVVKNGAIYNIWTLDVKGGLSRYTDAVAGNHGPVVLKGGPEGPRIAFVSYYKSDYAVHILAPREPIGRATTEDFGAPGPIVDFQAPLTHSLVDANVKRKGKFEKLYLEGRPPVNVGLTSSGDFLGGTAIAFTDVLGDQQFTFLAASISQYPLVLGVVPQPRAAVPVRHPGLHADAVLLRAVPRTSSTTRPSAASSTAIWPSPPSRRLAAPPSASGRSTATAASSCPAASSTSRKSSRTRPCRSTRRSTRSSSSAARCMNNGTMMPLGLTFVQETTIFREFGPLAGNTVRLAYEAAPGFAGLLSRQTVDGDVRKYFRIGGSGLLAFRARGFKSWGDSPGYYYFGGNCDMRGYEYQQFVGQNAGHLNAELRIPLIHAMATPIGILGGIRGTLFANAGGAYWNNSGCNA